MEFDKTMNFELYREENVKVKETLREVYNSLVEKGYNVFVIGYGQNTDKIAMFENIPYISMKTTSDNIILRLISRLVFGKKVVKYIDKNFKNIKGFLVVNRVAKFILQNKKIC